MTMGNGTTKHSSLFLLAALLSFLSCINGMVSNTNKNHGSNNKISNNNSKPMTRRRLSSKQQQQPRRQRGHIHKTNYFTEELELPPLEPISIDDNNENHIYRKSIPLVYTNDPKTVCRWLQDNLPMDGCILGFDVEGAPSGVDWIKPAFYGPATVQLATLDSCLIVHLAESPSSPLSSQHSSQRIHDCAPILKSVLCDDLFVKVGCNIDDDMVDLYDIWDGVHAESRLDLGGVGFKSKIRGLKTLSETILGLQLPKQRSISISDWSHVPLSKRQKLYCANDAWVAAAVANKLALHDPKTFSHDALVQMLSSQIPIKSLVEFQRAKEDLLQLLRPYSDLSPPTSCNKKIKKQQFNSLSKNQRRKLRSTKVLLTSEVPSSLPKRLHGKVTKLRNVIKNNVRDYQYPPPFDIDHLGYDFDP